MAKLKRIIAFVLATMMLSSVLLTASSCKKKGAKKKTISETDPWYTTKRIELDPKLSGADYFSVIPEGMWMCNDRFVTLYTVEERREENDSYYYELMGIFDMEGNLLQLVDLYDTMLYGVKGTGPDALAICEGEKGIRLYFENFATVEESDADEPFVSPTQVGNMTIKEFFYYCEFDPDSGEVVVPPQMIHTDPDNVYFYSMHIIEGYEVGSAVSYDVNHNPKLMITVSRNGEPLYHVELDSVFGPGVARFVDNMYGSGNGTVIIDCIGKTPMAAKLDLKTGKMTRLLDAKPISANQRISSTSEGKGYLTKATGIYEYDPTGASVVGAERRSLSDVSIVVFDVDYERVWVQTVGDAQALIDRVQICIALVADTDQKDLSVLLVETAQARGHRSRGGAFFFAFDEVRGTGSEDRDRVCRVK